MISWLKLQLESWIEYRRFTRAQDRRCESCESLRMENAFLRSQVTNLIDKMTEKPEPILEAPPSLITKPVLTGWNGKRREIEARSKQEARDIAKKISEDKKKEIDSIEEKVTSAVI